MSSNHPSHPYDPADVIGQLIRILQDILAVLAETHPGGILTTSMLNLTCRRLESYRHPHVSTEAAAPALVALTVLAAARPVSRPRRATRAPQRHPAPSPRAATITPASASATTSPRIRGPCRTSWRQKTRPTTHHFSRPNRYDIITNRPNESSASLPTPTRSPAIDLTATPPPSHIPSMERRTARRIIRPALH